MLCVHETINGNVVRLISEEFVVEISIWLSGRHVRDDHDMNAQMMMIVAEVSLLFFTVRQAE